MVEHLKTREKFLENEKLIKREFVDKIARNYTWLKYATKYEWDFYRCLLDCQILDDHLLEF